MSMEISFRDPCSPGDTIFNTSIQTISEKAHENKRLENVHLDLRLDFTLSGRKAHENKRL
jgi:hypothetical protein